jgi:hypothetical protein
MRGRRLIEIEQDICDSDKDEADSQNNEHPLASAALTGLYSRFLNWWRALRAVGASPSRIRCVRHHAPPFTEATSLALALFPSRSWAQGGGLSVLITFKFFLINPIREMPALSTLGHQINIVQTHENKTNLSLTG